MSLRVSLREFESSTEKWRTSLTGVVASVKPEGGAISTMVTSFFTFLFLQLSMPWYETPRFRQCPLTDKP